MDTNYRLTYTYNAFDTDPIYGIAPPAVGNAIIRSPLEYTGKIEDTVLYYEGKRKKIKVGVKELRLNSSVMFGDDIHEPRNHHQAFNTMRGLKNDGTPYINPTNGLPTTFVYSGDPVTNTGWIFPGSQNPKFFQGFGPLTMNPGDTQVIVVAQVIARGSSYLNSITKLREASQIAKNFYDNCFTSVVIGINSLNSSIPEKFCLDQNFPNPFNPTTKINYSLPTTQNLILKIFDVLGREVIELVNEKQNAGNYSVTFDGSGLSGGVYFYKLEAGDFVEVKKMILIK